MPDLTQQLKELLESDGYYNIKEIPGKGVCANQKFAFTIGIVYGIKKWGYVGRYCYSSKQEAEIALKHWTGEGHPPGLWIKHKGAYVEELNPLSV